MRIQAREYDILSVRTTKYPLTRGAGEQKTPVSVKEAESDATPRRLTFVIEMNDGEASLSTPPLLNGHVCVVQFETLHEIKVPMTLDLV